jgi:hypothetical protein
MWVTWLYISYHLHSPHKCRPLHTTHSVWCLFSLPAHITVLKSLVFLLSKC